jgi:hypothetical protein
MEKKSLLSKQVTIVLWLLGAAISAIETAAQFQRSGFSNWRVYFFSLIFITCVLMYFRKKKARFENNAS